MSELREELQRALDSRYALERELGRGGMGAVFLARDLTLDRPVAIKVLPPELAVRAELRERFLRETRTAASFSHPNIVPVHAVEEHEAILCFVMGYVEGETLAQRIRRAGPLPAAELVRLLQEVAWALSYAHGRGTVHRDVKPDNILIDRGTGRAMVTDFGIARSSEGAAAGLTRVGEVVGTPQFMSPEQASGDTIDGRSDLYSLGVVAFCAATGRVPFDAESTPAILAMQITRTPPSIATERPDLPASLAAAIDRLLAKSPNDRFPNGEALVEALDAARVSRPEIAPAIRLFQAKANQFFKNALMFALAGPFIVAGAQYDGDRAVLRAIVAVVVVALLLQIVVGMRQLARQGFRHENLRAGLAAIATEGAEARAQLRAAPNARALAWRRRVVLALIAGSGMAIAHYARSRRIEISPGMYHSTPATSRLAIVGIGLLVLALVFAIAGSGAAGGLNRLLGMLWSGPIGRFLFALAARGAAPAGLAGRGASRTGTLAGGRGPLDVLISLPRPARRELSKVEAALRALESEAAALAAREAQLSATLAEATAQPSGIHAAAAQQALVAELGGARSAASERREAITAALERMRLHLLRLKSDLCTPADVERELEVARGSLPSGVAHGRPAPV
ncbi:MAG: serine/threonine-protein kinase [Gemmatimonadota bacterium]